MDKKNNDMSLPKRNRIILFFLCIVAFASGFAQTNISNRGKEFWAGYGHHQYMEKPTAACTYSGDNSQEMVLYFATDSLPATVKVTIDSSGLIPSTWWSRTYNIPAYTAVSTETYSATSATGGAGLVGPMPKGTPAGTYDCRLITDPPPAGTGGEGIFRKKGIHIVSNVPIVAYAHIFGGVSSGATMLLPVESWGYSYTSVNSRQVDAGGPGFSWVFIIAKEDSTRIKITPSVPTRLNKPAGTPFQIDLRKGQIYQFIGQSDCQGNGNEFTGSTVESIPGPDGKCHPIAAFSGSSRTRGDDLTCGTSSGRDNDMQQMFPVQTWGRRYLTAPTSTSNGGSLTASVFQKNVFKVAVGDPSTIVKRNGVRLSDIVPSLFIRTNSTTVCPGSSVTFTAIPKNGGTSPVISWKVNGLPNGATGSTFTTLALATGDVVSASLQSNVPCASVLTATSNSITMTVAKTLVPSAVIYGNSDSLCSSTGSITYSALVTNGGVSPTFQWALNGAGVGTASTYTVSGLKNSNRDTLLCVVTSNAACASATPVFSNTIYVDTVVNTGANTGTYFSPSISILKDGVAVSTVTGCPGTSFTFVASTKNAGLSPTFDWKINNVSTGVTGNSFTTTSWSNGDKLTCTLTTSAVCATSSQVITSSFVLLSVVNNITPAVTVYATSEGLCGNTSTQFTAIPTNGGTAPIYQWYVNGTLVTSGSSPNFSASLSDGNSVNAVMISNAACLSSSSGSSTPIVLSTPGLIANKYYYYASNTADYIEADKPVMVAQFMSGSAACNPGGDGDPEMMYLSPIEQGVTYTGFVRNNREAIYSNYVTLVVPTAAVPSLRIDNSTVFSYTYPHPNLSGYTVVIKGWASAKAQSIVKCDSAFTGITYGLGAAESYGYNIGAYLNNLNAVSGLHNEPNSTDTLNKFTCSETDVNISVLVRYKPTSLLVHLDSLTTAIITPNSPVSLNPASAYLIDSPIVNKIQYFRYKLPGAYRFHSAGTFTIPVESVNPIYTSCSALENININFVVKAKPDADFSFINPGCSKDTVKFFGPATSNNGYDIGQWIWTFSSPTITSTKTDTAIVFSPGTYSAKLFVASKEGCSSDTTKTFTVGAPPVANFTAVPSAVCFGQSIAFTDTTNHTGETLTSWYWDMDDGQKITTNVSTVTKTYAAPGTYTVRHVLGTSATCIGDTATQVVTVSAKAQVAFTYPVGCLPLNNTADFSTITYGQTFTSYLWDFGDPGSGSANSSTLPNPSHTYSSNGTYIIKLSVVTSSGCAGDTSITATFGIRPTLNYPALTAVCESSAPISVATATVTNGVPGTGYYYGPGTNAAGTFDPAVAGPGTHQIFYAFTATGGCKDTTSSSITVNPKPAKPTVTSPVVYCQNAAAVALTATPATGLTWFNNPALTGGTTTAPVPSTAVAGTFNFYVNQENSGGCISDTATITVNVLQSISSNNITQDQLVCPGNPVLTLGGPIPSGGTGAFSYQWQQSTNGGASWSDITGATSSGYDPGTLSATTLFRRVATSGVCNNVSNVVTITVVGPITNTGISATQAVCAGAAPNLLAGQAAGGGGTIVYQWESSSDGVTWTPIPGATGQDYQPPVPTGLIYYHRLVSNGGCNDVSNAVTISVNANPDASITGSASDICQYDAASVSFTASAGLAPFTVVLTINGPSGTSTINQTINSNGPVTIPVIPVNSTAGTYTITFTSITDANTCSKNTGLGSVTINVNATPVLSTAANVPLCQSASVNLSVSGAATYSWSPATGLSTTTGASVTANPSSTTTYTITGTTNGCTATTTSTVNVTTKPAAPTATTPVDYCQNATASQLSASGAAGNTITWYNNAALTGGTTVAPTPSTATAGSTSYYVTQSTSGGCASDPSTITVNVTPAVAGNTISADQNICSSGTPAMLTAPSSPSGGTGTFGYQWEQSTDGGSTWNNIPGATADSYSPGLLSSTTMYRRVITSGLCSSTSNAITITVLADIANNSISTTQPTVCEGVTPSLVNGQAATGGGTLVYQWESSTDASTWTPITSSNVQSYQPPLLTVTTLYRRKVNNAACSSVSNVVTITVNAKPIGAISSSVSAICQYNAASVSFSATAGTAPFTVTLSVTGPSGTNTITQTINSNGPVSIPVIPLNSAAGNYTITFTSLSDVNCSNTTGLSPVNITVNATPVLSTTSSVQLCQGTTTNLSVSGATSYSWSPATGLSSTTGATVTANPPSTTTYTITGTTNGCSATTTATVNVNAKPSAPTVVTPVNYCQNTPASPLSATGASGNTVTWYNNPGLTGGSTSVPTPNTGVSGTVTYYVTQTTPLPAGCISDPSVITVNVTPALTGNSINKDTTICSSNPMIPLTPAGTVGGGTGTLVYQWQQSTDGGTTWTNISGANADTYNPGSPLATTMYRRVITSGLCSSTSNAVTITVLTNIANNSITLSKPSICEGITPATITGQAATGGGTLVYQWESSTDGTTWTPIPSSNVQSYQPPALTTNTWYRRKVSNASCTSTSNAVTINVNPKPAGAISSSVTAICQYDAASVSFIASAGTAPFTVVLTVTGPSGSNTITQNISSNGPVLIPVIPVNSGAGAYTIAFTSLTDSKGCLKNTSLGSVNIIVNPTPVLTPGGNKTVCIKDSTTLSVTGAASYTWSPATGLSSTSGSSVKASPSSTTTYTITGTTNGCNGSAVQVKVTVNPRPAAPTVTTPVAACQNSSVSLTATAAPSNTLTWYNNPALTAGSPTTPTVNTSVAGSVNYYVTQSITSTGCMSDPSTITVNVTTAIGSNTIGRDTTLCSANSPKPLDGLSLTGGTGIYDVQWQQSVSASPVWTNIPGATSLSYDPGVLGTTTQYRRVINSGVCSSISNVVTITVIGTLANTGLNSGDQTVCNDKRPSLIDGKATTGAGSISYQWQQSLDGTAFTNIAGATTEDYQPPLLNTTTFYRRIVSNTACSATSPVVQITVNPVPVVSAGPDFAVMEGSVIHFAPVVPQNQGFLTYLWSPADMDDPEALAPTLVASHDQTYKLTVTGVPPTYCSNSDYLTVKILRPVTIPNAFSPNGDGINDTWNIENLKDYPGASVQIYNRYGQLVYKTTGYSAPWDGTLKGKLLPVATYYYVIELKNGFKPVTGSVTILR